MSGENNPEISSDHLGTGFGSDSGIFDSRRPSMGAYMCPGSKKAN